MKLLAGSRAIETQPEDPTPFMRREVTYNHHLARRPYQVIGKRTRAGSSRVGVHVSLSNRCTVVYEA